MYGAQLEAGRESSITGQRMGKVQDENHTGRGDKEGFRVGEGRGNRCSVEIVAEEMIGRGEDRENIGVAGEKIGRR